MSTDPQTVVILCVHVFILVAEMFLIYFTPGRFGGDFLGIKGPVNTDNRKHMEHTPTVSDVQCRTQLSDHDMGLVPPAGEGQKYEAV